MNLEVSFSLTHEDNSAMCYANNAFQARLTDQQLTEVLEDLATVFGVQVNVRMSTRAIDPAFLAVFFWKRFMSLTKHHETNFMKAAIESRLRLAEERFIREVALKPYLRDSKR